MTHCCMPEKQGTRITRCKNESGYEQPMSEKWGTSLGDICEKYPDTVYVMLSKDGDLIPYSQDNVRLDRD